MDTMGTMSVMLMFLAISLYGVGVEAAVSAAAVSAGLKMADKAIGVVDKGVDVLTKIDGVLTGKLNAHYQAVAERPENLIKPGDVAAIANKMKSGEEITFENLRGFDGNGEYQPPGWTIGVKASTKTKQPDAEKKQVFSYPMGVGTMLMSGCFGSGYKKGDPCYKNLRFTTLCRKQLDSANFIGVGFDITQSYSSESRKKSVVQRVCKKKATFLNGQVPDNMNAYGIYDYSIRTHSFQSATNYRKYLAHKSGIQMSGGVFSKVSSDWQRTASAGSSTFLSDVGVGHSRGGSKSSESGMKLSSLLQNQMGSESSVNRNTFIAVLEADVKLYEIALDHSSPDDLSAPFLNDFMHLPTSYYLIGADIKLQDFVLRYGTHFVKSAKFGGKLNIFKSSSASSTQSQTQFAQSAETEFSAMMSTLSNSFSQTHVKANIFGTGAQASSKSRSASGSQKSMQSGTKTSKQSGSQSGARSQFIQTTVDAQGGDPDIAASIMDFYTPAFKARFVKWIASIPQYPKPYDMTFGRIPELFDVSTESLFKVGKPKGGCFGKLQKDDLNRRFFLKKITTKNAKNETETITEKVICKYPNREKFMEDFKAKRLALERSITIFMAEGPFSTSTFDLPAGSKGCETDTIDYVTKDIKQSHSWPSWKDIVDASSFKVLFQLPVNIPSMQKNVEFEVKYNSGLWFTKTLGSRFTIGDTCAPAPKLPTKNRICVANLRLLYNEDYGFFKFDTEFYKSKTTNAANITKSYGHKFVARAEVDNILKKLQKNKLGEVPCNIKWSNAHRIDPQQKTSCIHFSAASKGDIFIIFASIPKDHSTWYYIQMSPTGIAFYRGMQAEKVDAVQSSGTLGDESLFETFFVCVSQGNKKRNMRIMYGKAPAQREIGMVHAAFTFPNSKQDSVSFYSFGSGEEKVTIDDVRVIKEGPSQMKCAGNGLVMLNGECTLDCDPQCSGCHQAKDARSCTACKKMKYFYETQKFVCQELCPAKYETNGQRVCTPCKPGHYKNVAGNQKCLKCGKGTIAPTQGMDKCTPCPKGQYQSGTGQTTCLQCNSGTAAANTGMHECSRCTIGHYQNKKGQQACSKCEFGYQCPRVALSNHIQCPVNTYNDQEGQSKCKPCPNGKNSAVASKSCGNACSRGHYLKPNTGCLKCAKDTIAPAAGTDVCQACAAGTASNNGRTKCEEINECATNPCRNGARCEDKHSAYKCHCKPGYTGKECQTEIDQCAKQRPCRNGAQCKQPKANKWECVCRDNFMGTRCESVIPTSTIYGGNWKFVRHVPAGNRWHAASDQLRGTDVYGKPCGKTCGQEWSVRFDNQKFNEFLFATGDERKWLIAEKETVTGTYYHNIPRLIIKSSTSVITYMARWYRRTTNLEDPWISLTDHHAAIGQGNILYGENHAGGTSALRILPSHKGANVFIRWSAYFDSRAPPLSIVTSQQTITRTTSSNGVMRLGELGKLYEISLEVYATSFISNWGSILHMTVSENDGVYGARVPGIWFRPVSTSATKDKLYICNAISGNKDFCKDSVEFPKGRWISITVSQQLEGKDFMYRIFVDNQKILETVNTQPKYFNGVKVYVGDPWSAAQPGHIRNLKIVGARRAYVVNGQNNCAGRCPNGGGCGSVCGAGGDCCRRGFKQCSVELEAAAPDNYHTCIKYTNVFYNGLGCYTDRPNRAIGGTVIRLPAETIVRQCSMIAKSRGHPMFAVEADVECYTARNGLSTYKKHGVTSGCKNGRGGLWKMSVYQFR